jgi:hypothetical protein
MHPQARAPVSARRARKSALRFDKTRKTVWTVL